MSKQLGIQTYLNLFFRNPTGVEHSIPNYGICFKHPCCGIFLINIPAVKDKTFRLRVVRFINACSGLCFHCFNALPMTTHIKGYDTGQSIWACRKRDLLCSHITLGICHQGHRRHIDYKQQCNNRCHYSFLYHCLTASPWQQKQLLFPLSLPLASCIHGSLLTSAMHISVSHLMII